MCGLLILTENREKYGKFPILFYFLNIKYTGAFYRYHRVEKWSIITIKGCHVEIYFRHKWRSDRAKFYIIFIISNGCYILSSATWLKISLSLHDSPTCALIYSCHQLMGGLSDLVNSDWSHPFHTHLYCQFLLWASMNALGHEYYFWW